MKSVAVALAVVALTACTRKDEPAQVEPASKTMLTGARVDTADTARPESPAPNVTPQSMAAASAPGPAPTPTLAMPAIVVEDRYRPRNGTYSIVAMPSANLGVDGPEKPAAAPPEETPRLVVAPPASTPATAPRAPSAGDANPWSGSTSP